MGLPPHITATTGMDALTHAVEAYIGRSNTQETREWSKRAVKLVFENISEAYNNGECVYRPLAELADVAGIADGLKSDREKAESFIYEIRQLNKEMSIPDNLQGIDEKDIPVMVERAFHESNPLYPVPRFFDKDDLGEIYNLIRV